MIALVQRVTSSSVAINNVIKNQISGLGLLIFLCITKNDSEKDVNILYNKISNFRIFADNQKKMNLSIKDINGSIMIVSQFTLCGNTDNGRRPSFERAAKPVVAKKLYNYFINMFKRNNFIVKGGEFGKDMDISLVNTGPSTFYFNTDENDK